MHSRFQQRQRLGGFPALGIKQTQRLIHGKDSGMRGVELG
jgi:hypothetical protein